MKINYELELGAARMALDGLKKARDTELYLRRIEALQKTIDEIVEKQQVLKRQHEALPVAIKKAEANYNKLRMEAQLASNAKLQELLKLQRALAK